MDFRIFFEPILNGILSVFEWLGEIGGSFFWAEFFTIFIILTVARLFFSRITGVYSSSSSDSVKDLVPSNQSEGDN